MENDRIIVLNPDYHFRNDLDRIALYSFQDTASYSEANWLSYIHPVQAQILTLFAQEHSLEENITTISQSFQTPIQKVRDLITPYIQNEASVFTEFKSEKIYFPKNLLMDVSLVDKTKRHHRKGGIKKEDISTGNKTINLTQDRLHRAPLYFLFMVTNKCVTNCKYCYADRNTRCTELSTPEILRIIDEAERLGMTHIDVIGGEYFLKKDWDIILQHLVKADLSPTFISTKIPFTEESVQKLQNTGYKNVIQISLDTLDNSKSQAIIRSWPTYLEEMKRGISILQENYSNIFIDTILTKYTTNQEDILTLYDYVKTIKGLKRWEIRVPEYSIYNSKTFSEVKPYTEDAAKICEFVRKEIMPQAPFPILVNDNALQNFFRKGQCTDFYFEGGQCGILKKNCFVLPDGKVSVCERLFWHPKFIIGDLKTQSFEEVWQSDKAKSFFSLKQDYYRKQSLCSRCNNFSFCNENYRRCWVRVVKAYGYENWDYPDPYCCYAPPILTDMMYNLKDI